jgi:hypothetical protein
MNINLTKDLDMRAFPRGAVPCRVWFLLVCAALSGCGDRSPRSGSIRGSPAEAQPVPNAKEHATPEDRSLTSDEYIRLGLSAHDRLWSGDDMASATKVLSGIAQRDPGQLPRYRSEHSGAVFARLTAAQNLEFYRNRSLPLDVRFPQAITYFESTNQLLKLYLAAHLKKATGDV